MLVEHGRQSAPRLLCEDPANARCAGGQCIAAEFRHEIQMRHRGWCWVMTWRYPRLPNRQRDSSMRSIHSLLRNYGSDAGRTSRADRFVIIAVPRASQRNDGRVRTAVKRPPGIQGPREFQLAEKGRRRMKAGPWSSTASRTSRVSAPDLRLGGQHKRDWTEVISNRSRGRQISRTHQRPPGQP